MSNLNNINWFEMCESLAFLKRQVTPKKTYYYFRLAKPQIKMHAPYGTHAFYEEYQSLLNNLQKQQVQEAVKKVDYTILTLGGLWEAFKKSEYWSNLATSTQEAKIRRFEPIIKDNLDVAWVRLTHHEIGEKLQDVAKGSAGGSAKGLNQRDQVYKDFSGLFKWAINNVKECPDDFANPCSRLSKIQKKKDQKPQRVWKKAEIQAFLEFHKSGTMAHLAVLLISEVGTAACDSYLLGHIHLVDDSKDKLRFHRQKTKVMCNQRMSSKLVQEIQKTSFGKTFIHKKNGKKFASSKSFSNRFKAWVLKAGLADDLTIHGLRRYAAVTAAKAGATEYELMQMFGWSTTTEPLKYIEEAKSLGFLGSDKILQLKQAKEDDFQENNRLEYKEIAKLSTKIKLRSNIKHLSKGVVHPRGLTLKK